MARTTGVFLAGLLLILAGPARADDPPAGTWKFTYLEQGQTVSLWILKLEKKGDQWAGSVVAFADKKLSNVNVENISVTPDAVRFTLRLQGPSFSFEGRLPPAKNQSVL